jgi:hypothetical protein
MVLLPPLELPGRIASEVEVVRLHAAVAVMGELDLNQVFDREGQIADRAFGANLWSTRRAIGTRRRSTGGASWPTRTARTFGWSAAPGFEHSKRFRGVAEAIGALPFPTLVKETPWAVL